MLPDTKSARRNDENQVRLASIESAGVLRRGHHSDENSHVLQNHSPPNSRAESAVPTSPVGVPVLCWWTSVVVVTPSIARTASPDGPAAEPVPDALSGIDLLHAIGGGPFAVVGFFSPQLWWSVVNWGPVDPTITRLYGGAGSSIALGSGFGYRAESWGDVRILVRLDTAFAVLTGIPGLYEGLLGDGPVFTWVRIVIAAFFANTFSFYYQRLEG